jgi:hypothetical protein
MPRSQGPEAVADRLRNTLQEREPLGLHNMSKVQKNVAYSCKRSQKLIF